MILIQIIIKFLNKINQILNNNNYKIAIIIKIKQKKRKKLIKQNSIHSSLTEKLPYLHFKLNINIIIDKVYIKYIIDQILKKIWIKFKLKNYRYTIYRYTLYIILFFILIKGAFSNIIILIL